MAFESISRLGRIIGWRSAAAVVIANMVGTKIFTTSGLMHGTPARPKTSDLIENYSSSGFGVVA